jgi:cell division protein FtsZ
MLAEDGIDELHRHVDTLIVIPNQNLFRVANEKTTFADAFSMADEVLYSGVGCITDLMVKEGLINLDFADVRAVMRGMGKAMMGTGEAEGEERARHAAEAAIANPLLDDISMSGAHGLLISITGGSDLTLYEVDEAASRIREEVDADANIILGATFDDSLQGRIRVSVVATGTEAAMVQAMDPPKPIERPIQLRRDGVAETKPEPQQAVEASKPAELDTQMQAAVAQAISAGSVSRPQHAADEDVTVEPYIPQAEPAAELDHEEPRRPEAAPPQSYVPQAAERPDGARRMPRTDELPQIARKAMGGAPEAEEEHGHRNARALFRRLASNVGLQKKVDEQTERREPGSDDLSARNAVEASAPRAPQAPAPQQRSAAHEGAAGQNDGHGRVAPEPRADSGREHLEIPSFLRKHG